MSRFLKVVFLLLIFPSVVQAQTCAVNYTYSGSADTYSFINTSTVSNAHYYWNFGDGDGSNTTNPVHIFPDDGEYLVTLYCHDTISDCSNYTEKLIIVNKPDTISCNLYFTDTIVGTNCIKTDMSTGCLPFYSKGGDAGPCSDQWHCFFWAGWKSSLFISKLKAWHSFPTTPFATYVVYKEYFKTIKRDYSPSVNYQNCSANFEVTVNYQANGATVNFAAMNRNATSYKWMIVGFGGPIYSYTSTMNHLYPYPPKYQKSKHWIVVLYTYDATNNCGDTVTQNILIKNLNYSIPINVGLKEYGSDEFSLNIFPNPARDKIVIKSTIEAQKMTLVSSLGQELFVLDKPMLEQEIDISHLRSGIYFLKAQSKEGHCVYKILKE